MNERYCFHCMNPAGEGDWCMSCGHAARDCQSASHQLPEGSVLAQRYLVGRVLGEGGFGITYVGRDLRLNLRVAIKEFFPADCAMRNAKASLKVRTYAGSTKETFLRGKHKFLKEAQIMASMEKQQAIVGVRDFFEENNTAYIVMEYIEGITLETYVEQRGGRIDVDDLLVLLYPLFDALTALHTSGLIHRDISPDNLMLEGNRIRLIDFGCAREGTTGSVTMTVAFKYDYAPIEQFNSKGQGPWSDVYALCASIYRCITGQAPPCALDRIASDDIRAPSELGVRITHRQERALMQGLRVRQGGRFQSVAALKNALFGGQQELLAEWGSPEWGSTDGGFPRARPRAHTVRR